MCKTSKGTAKPTVFIENQRTRVTEWRFPAGGDTGWHVHDYDYVVVPLFTGFLHIDTLDGSRQRVELQNGVPYFRELGVNHNVINANGHEVAFVEIEFLDQPKPADPADPA